MVKLGIAYLVFCEALLCFVAGAISYVHFHPRGALRDYVWGIAHLLISLFSMWALIGLLRRDRYAWWSSFIIGLIVIGLIAYSVWFGITYANPYTDEGDSVIYGVAMLLPAFVVLWLPATRRYLKREAKG